MKKYLSLCCVLLAQPALSKHLVFAIDGFSTEAFEHLKAEGSFAAFNSHGSHIAPFPSMTEPSWTALSQAERIYGPRANVRTVEAKYLDREKGVVQADSRQYFLRMAHPNNFMRAFDYYFSPFYEALMYFPAQAMIQKEFTEIEQSIEDGFKGEEFVVYVSSVDAIAHTHKDEVLPLLRRIDTLIQRVQKKYGPDLRISLISDHGNVGRAPLSKPDLKLIPVNLNPALKRAGMHLGDSLRKDRDVVLPIMALGSAASLDFKNLQYRDSTAQKLLQEKGVEHAIWSDSAGTIHILRKDEEALLRYRTQGGSREYCYAPKKGNPLLITESLWSNLNCNNWTSDQQMRQGTQDGAFPDAPARLADFASGQIQNRADLTLTLKDGYFFQGPLSEYVHMYRTHGSLSAKSSLALVASTEGSLPTYLRSAEVLPTLGLNPEKLFEHPPLKPTDALKLARKQDAEGGIPTQMDQLDGNTLYLRLSKLMSQSMEFVDAASTEQMFALFQSWSEKAKQSNSSKTQLDHELDLYFKDLKSTQWKVLLDHMDEFFLIRQKLSQENPKDSADATLKALRQSLLQVKGLEPLSRIFDRFEQQSKSKGPLNPKAKEGIQVLRHFVMKMWTVPYLVQEMLNLPEFSKIPDSRNLGFADSAIKALGQTQASERKAWLLAHSKELMAEIYKERQLVQKLSPAPVAPFYDHPMIPSDLALVFVPGIYNELFDKEIFARGLRALEQNFNVRTLYVDVDGRCGSDINSKQILEALKEDQRSRLERGYPSPRYIIFGYSKGGVDATEMLLLDTNFSKEHVQALLGIASPQMGAPIIESSDLPKVLIQNTIFRPENPLCKNSTASKSLFVENREQFWNTNSDKLKNLSPLLSISFQSDLEHAHPWMKIAKLLGRFDGPNDGVVPLSRSKFPSTIGNMDLGVVEGDHLSGILASSFPQEAFFESAWLMLMQMGLDLPENKALWLPKAIQSPAAPKAQTLSPVQTPPSNLNWSASKIIDLRRYPDELARALVSPILPTQAGPWAQGIKFKFDHPSVLDFRHSYGFSYESKSPAAVDDNPSAYSGERDSLGPFLHMKSKNNSIRLTTSAFRFKPHDFPDFGLKLKVNQGVVGADPAKGGSGKDDAAFQIWFTLRNLEGVKDRSHSSGKEEVLLFGYYWADPNEKGKMPLPGTVVENTYSKKNYLVVTLPETYQIPLDGGKQNLGKWQNFHRNLAEDLQKAFPLKKMDQYEIMSITLQTDSNDSESESDCALSEFSFQKL